MPFKVDAQITLPIGLDWKGNRYRNFVIDEMRGVDEENISTHKVKNNGAKAVTMMLQRSVQSIEGLLDSKKDQYELINANFIRNLYTPDRDFLFMAMQALSLESTFTSTLRCPRCQEPCEHVVDINELEVLEWDVPDPLTAEPEIEVQIPRGILLPNKTLSKSLRWKFLTGVQQENIATLPQSKQTTGALTLGIVWVDGLDSRPDTELVRRMTTRDRMYVLEEVKAATPGLDLGVECLCENDKCGHQWRGEIDINNFFNSTAANATKTNPEEIQTTSAAGNPGQKKHKRLLRKR